MLLLMMDLVSVGGIGFDSPHALPSLLSSSLVWCHLRCSVVMPRCLVMSIPCRIDAPVPHQCILFSRPIVSVIVLLLSWILPIPLAALATLTDLSYQKRAMPANPSFHNYPSLLSILWTSTVLFHMLDDDVVETLCFDPRSPVRPCHRAHPDGAGVSPYLV